MVTIKDVNKLTRWKLAAFVARCARRVDPLYARQDGRDVVSSAINEAERFARGDDPTTDSDIAIVDMCAADAKKLAAELRHQDDIAAGVARAAGWATETVSSAFGHSDAADTAVKALEAANSALVAATASVAAGRLSPGAQVALANEIQRDYEKLLSRPDEPVDPTKHGPLGPVWRQKLPRGWPAATEQSAGSHAR